MSFRLQESAVVRILHDIYNIHLQRDLAFLEARLQASGSSYVAVEDIVEVFSDVSER
jgi:hypothetical protein